MNTTLTPGTYIRVRGCDEQTLAAGIQLVEKVATEDGATVYTLRSVITSIEDEFDADFIHGTGYWAPMGTQIVEVVDLATAQAEWAAENCVAPRN